MKKIIFVLAGLALNLSANSGGNFGAGFVLGEPNGFTLKYWTIPEKVALDFGIGWGGSFNNNNNYYADSRCYNGNFYNNNPGLCNANQYGWQNFHVHGDYLIHNFQAIQAREKFPIYYGPGLFYDYWRSGYYNQTYNRSGGFAELGIRGVFGISWIPRNSPFDVFVELAPGFAVFPGPNFLMNAGLGGRYWF